MGTSFDPLTDRAKSLPPSAHRAKKTSNFRSNASQSLRMVSRHPIPPPERQPAWGERLRTLGAIALLVGIGAGELVLSQLSLQLIVNPQSVTWVNQWVPGWAVEQSTQEQAKTLPQIRSTLWQQGQHIGELIELGRNHSIVDDKEVVTDVLLPVLQTEANCFSECDRIVELRVYQTAPLQRGVMAGETTYYLVHQLPVSGVEESLAIAPLVDANSHNQGSSRQLPLTQLSRFEGRSSQQGIWLNLSSSRTRGDETIAYGYILYYHPLYYHLSSKLSWTSPTGESPVWKEVTGGETPELIVNQTIGMEPQYDIYQVHSQPFIHSPIRLEQISLAATALDNSQYSQYENALLLARNRLWSTSLAWLESVRASSPQHWTKATQAQLDLVKWHAQATATQADGSWASPAQQVLANLLDGRWERATQVFESSIAASQETVSVLQADQGRLENRVKAALRVNPDKLDAKIWGALLLTAQHTPNRAIVWLKTIPKTKPQDMARIQHLMQRLDPTFSDSDSQSTDVQSTMIDPAPKRSSPSPSPQ